MCGKKHCLVMCCITSETHYVKCVVSQFCCCPNSIECMPAKVAMMSQGDVITLNHHGVCNPLLTGNVTVWCMIGCVGPGLCACFQASIKVLDISFKGREATAFSSDFSSDFLVRSIVI